MLWHSEAPDFSPYFRGSGMTCPPFQTLILGPKEFEQWWRIEWFEFIFHGLITSAKWRTAYLISFSRFWSGLLKGEKEVLWYYIYREFSLTKLLTTTTPSANSNVVRRGRAQWPAHRRLLWIICLLCFQPPKNRLSHQNHSQQNQSWSSMSPDQQNGVGSVVHSF